MSSSFSPPAVTSLRLSSDKQQLTISFKDGFEAVCQLNYCVWNHRLPRCKVMDQIKKQLVRDKQHVKITAIEPVGHYAVRLIFDDGHDTGLYSWALFYEYGKNSQAMMDAYRAASHNSHNL